MTGDDHGGAPLYQRIKAELRAAVGRGEYEPGSPFVTQRELCERYGVSTTTAVKALNDLVAEGLLVRRRGRGTFVAEQAERTAGSGAPSAVACIVHGLPGAHVSNLVSGVESVCSELGYRMYLADTARRDVHASPGREARALQEAIDSDVAGIVLYPVEGQHNMELLGEVQRRGIPLVLVDRYRTDIPTDAVVVDNFAIGYQLTRHLIDAGHERILTLWSETKVTSVQDRLTGHVQALRERGLPIIPALTALRPYGEQPESVRLALLQSALDSAEPPTAALCANGYVVANVAKDLVSLGRTVPGDVELAGMDDAGPFDLLGLTTVAAELPSNEMGATAMRLLAERIAGTTDGPRHVTLPTGVHTRDATSGYLRAVGGETT
ncbi:GntR family transcriptional regulator [Actinocatenispora rupis]|uniref:LacI family transcriptional regulator n=1 Tax=Actinocatenispora rupis TaxID=519421 RepID=A0A8J3N888_9ACTN|nr:GntR family transcriptional regulator [Actinocatenispora rupis]GID10054.1 LacI family transcriptional regulator [Actinocatenispora rupis]